MSGVSGERRAQRQQVKPDRTLFQDAYHEKLRGFFHQPIIDACHRKGFRMTGGIGPQWIQHYSGNAQTQHFAKSTTSQSVMHTCDTYSILKSCEKNGKGYLENYSSCEVILIIFPKKQATEFIMIKLIMNIVSINDGSLISTLVARIL